ncbi:MAG: DNA repair protein RecN [Treponemataceae bacterium]
MLEELVVKDFALIDRLTVEFDEGLNILTGETGAGKSIIVGALGFLLGCKTDADSIRSGKDETSVSAVLKIDGKNSLALEWLRAHDISPDEGRIMLRRSLKRSGRSVAYIQDAPVSRNELADFTSFLFDIHGQHEHQALMKVESHRQYLDRFAGIGDEVAAFTSLFLDLSEKRKELQIAVEAEKGRDQRIELLNFAIEEINSAKVLAGESAGLEAEAKRLSEYEKLAGLISGASQLLIDDENSAIALLRKAMAQLEAAALVDETLQLVAKRITDVFYEAEDASEQIRNYRDDLRYDPDRLEAVEERLALLYKLKKKYGSDEEAILSYQVEAEKEIDSLNRIEENRTALAKEIAEKEKEVSLKAKVLSEKRISAAVSLGSRITEILATLGMAKARFKVSVLLKGDASSGRICGPWGIDDVQFLIAPNQGEEMRDLVKIASGGELSRVMLAIKTVLANADTVETLIFDEIDTGIGGEVALSVGEHLKTLGHGKQIFCITHLASIAVRADNHLKVLKGIDGERTTTTVIAVDSAMRREEIARMLAGDAVGEAALAHADELLQKYGSRG